MINSQEEIADRIKNSTRDMIDSLGYDLVELKYSRTSYGMAVQFLIDRKEGGITVEECTQLNRSIGEMLDHKNIISGKYVLEVSSPGLDRSLSQEGDFRRALNSNVRVFLKEPIEEKLEFQGKILSVDSECVCLETEKNNQMVIQFSKINKAKQEI